MTEILVSLDKVNIAMSAIAKDQQGYGYKFRGIDQVLNHLSPLFKEHQIVVSRKILKWERSRITSAKGKPENDVAIHVEYKFTSLVDGSQFVSEGIGEGQDQGDKGTACAISNSYKYVIFEMFNIPTNDQIDSDQNFARNNKQKDNDVKERENKIEGLMDLIKHVNPKAPLDEWRSVAIKLTGDQLDEKIKEYEEKFNAIPQEDTKLLKNMFENILK